MGAKEPDVLVLLADEVNMAVTRVGVRGRSVLFIGIPMWLLLTPEMRVAVLAHELGHLSNRDPLRGTLTRPATAIFASAVEWTGGHNPWRRMGDRLDRAEDDSFVTMLFRLLLAMLNTVFATIQLAIDAIAMSDHRRAEYAADLASREAVGSRAAIATVDRLTVLGDLVDGLVHDVVTKRSEDWGTLADRRHAQLQDELEVRRQASRRMVDLWVTHPPDGSRAALLEGLPSVPGTVSVDPAESARIDVELRNWYLAAHREILGARDFLG